jgi:hypothetical protein
MDRVLLIAPVPKFGRCVVVLALGYSVGISAQVETGADVVAERAEADSSRFVFIPYPITEPAIGTGLLAGPVWLRDAPQGESGPKKPQAFGAGALWTDGGSRGIVAFDHRAWGDTRWRTTAVAAKFDLDLTYSGLSPVLDESRGFTLHLKGAGIEGDKGLGDGPNSLLLRLISGTAEAQFDASVPTELANEPKKATVTSLGVGWSRDTRDSVFTPSTGNVLSAGLTAYPQALGSSFDAQSLTLQWITYQSGLGKGTLGVNSKMDFSFGNPPFYLRPYISLRGIPALRYPGEQVASVETEYRWPVNALWDLLVFGGVGTARADIDGITGRKSVATGGVGIRFKVRKLFGLTFGLDFAQGPEGEVTYVQIGNAWSR